MVPKPAPSRRAANLVHRSLPSPSSVALEKSDLCRGGWDLSRPSGRCRLRRHQGHWQGKEHSDELRGNRAAGGEAGLATLEVVWSPGAPLAADADHPTCAFDQASVVASHARSLKGGEVLVLDHIDALVAAVGTGMLPVQRLDDSVAHILATKGANVCAIPRS